VKKLTTQEFINRANKIHNNQFDYSMTEYLNSHSKVKIICPTHGIFEQLPYHHLNGSKCASCSNSKQLNTTEFIKRAQQIHSNKYDYKLVDYVNSRSKVKIICPIHGIFEQTPKNHTINKCDCPKCKGFNKDDNDLIMQFKKIHGELYDYSLYKYNGTKKFSKFICKKHGIFEQYTYNHLKGFGCSKCSGRYKYTNQDFIEKANIVHNNIYDYTAVELININEKVKIICSKHGMFEQRGEDHIRGAGCPICKSSKGEKQIINYLNSNNILFIRQKKFNECRNKYKLPFDFYLPEYLVCLEFNGRQHYEVVEAWGGQNALQNTKLNDEIKLNFCKRNGIKLLIIRYDENVEYTLKNANIL
jgi:hypothetical protein